MQTSCSSQENLEKKNRIVVHTLSNFKTYYKATIIKQHDTDVKTYKQINRIEYREIRFTYKIPSQVNKKRNIFLTNGDGKNRLTY